MSGTVHMTTSRTATGTAFTALSRVLRLFRSLSARRSRRAVSSE